MARQHENTPETRPAEDSVEAAILRRRRVLKKAALLGIPMILTLHGTARANTQDSGQMSGNMSHP